jgi:hypothetical protein
MSDNGGDALSQHQGAVGQTSSIKVGRRIHPARPLSLTSGNWRPVSAGNWFEGFPPLPIKFSSNFGLKFGYDEPGSCRGDGSLPFALVALLKLINALNEGQKVMRRLYTLLCTMALVLAGTSAYAQSANTFVSATGSDANACTQAAPCLTFQRALTQTAAFGSILCLNSGLYSTATLTITQSVTIDCGTGNVGKMDLSTSGTTAIVINAGSTVHVTLRHLSLLGFPGTSGIVTTGFPPGSSLDIEQSLIGSFLVSGGVGGFGVSFTPTGSGRSTLAISDSLLVANGVGVSVVPPSGQITSVLFVNTGLSGSTTDGLDLAGAGVTAGDMRGSVLANNGGNGFTGSSAGGVFFTIENSTFSANLGVGIQTNSAGASVDVAGSTIGGNGTGVQALSGSLVSFGNNHISANGANGSFTSKISQQ